MTKKQDQLKTSYLYWWTIVMGLESTPPELAWRHEMPTEDGTNWDMGFFRCVRLRLWMFRYPRVGPHSHGRFVVYLQDYRNQNRQEESCREHSKQYWPLSAKRQSSLLLKYVACLFRSWSLLEGAQRSGSWCQWDAMMQDECVVFCRKYLRQFVDSLRS